MLKRDCAEVRPHLSAFHDEELPVEDRIAISAHLQDCPGCALEAEDLRTIRDALRGAAAAIQVGWSPELSGMPCGAPGRVKAERDESRWRAACHACGTTRSGSGRPAAR